MTTENNNQIKWYETMTVKMILLGAMAIMFLIPLELIKIVIRERELNSEAVKTEISELWGKEQTISGPVLNIPLYETIINSDKKSESVRRVWHILPESLLISGDINPEIRYKGIYETVIYNSELNFSGEYILPVNSQVDKYSVAWDEAYLTMGISDNRGLTREINISLGDKTIDAEPGLIDLEVFSSGISFPAEIDPALKTFSFEMSMGLRGSEGVYFTPVGKSTVVKVQSDWTAPSFNGKFLPAPREITETGFSATWEVTHLNRNFPQDWVGRINNIEEERFGVDLILEIDHYQKSERSAKYGLLFIAFTFLVLLFIEVSSDKRIHIFSYFLVSLALVLFFSLLNALSEHIGFNAAYIIASLSTISMITGFSGALLRTKRSVLIIGGLLTVLYVFLFFLLSLNEYAYLAGNIGLFIGLGAIMWLTSKTDLFKRNEI